MAAALQATGVEATRAAYDQLSGTRSLQLEPFDYSGFKETQQESTYLCTAAPKTWTLPTDLTIPQNPAGVDFNTKQVVPCSWCIGGYQTDGELLQCRALPYCQSGDVCKKEEDTCLMDPLHPYTFGPCSMCVGDPVCNGDSKRCSCS